MSTTAAPRVLPLVLPRVFLDRLVVFLAPFFLPVCEDDMEIARAEVLETLASYGARTRAEMLHATRVVAYSMSGLMMLTEATILPLSDSMRLRYRGSANSLNKLCQQDELSLAKRLACEPVTAVPIVGAPNGAVARMPQGGMPQGYIPEEEISEEEIPEEAFAAMLAQAQAAIEDHRARAAGHAAALPPDAEPARIEETAAPVAAAPSVTPSPTAAQAAAPSAASPGPTRQTQQKAAAPSRHAIRPDQPANQRPWGSAMLAALASEMTAGEMPAGKMTAGEMPPSAAAAP